MQDTRLFGKNSLPTEYSKLPVERTSLVTSPRPD